jgi:hypothetical protein
MRFTRLTLLSLTAAMIVPSGEAMAFTGPLTDPGDPTQTYTFDELGVNCGWFAQTSGLYADLVFPSPAGLAVCNTPNGTVGLMPSALVTGRVEIRVTLPRPASAVSIQSYLNGVGEAPTLIAYGADGVELGRASDGTASTWTTLAVQSGGDAQIVEIGLFMPQLVVYLDNLTVTYQSGEAGEPEPSPTPAVPVTRVDCIDGHWADFGFRNQGQCVRFVMTGKDSR